MSKIYSTIRRSKRFAHDRAYTYSVVAVREHEETGYVHESRKAAGLASEAEAKQRARAFERELKEADKAAAPGDNAPGA